MAKMKLHVFPPSPNARMVQITANHLGSDVEICPLDLLNGAQGSAEFRALNPNGLMPVLEDGDFVLWESTAIMQYLASQEPERKLWPSEARPQADVSRWLAWRLAHWGPTCGIFTFENLVKGLTGGGEADPAAIAKGEESLAKYGKVLDDHLAGRSYLVGDDLTLADIAIGAWLTHHQAAKIPLGDFPEVRRWHESLEAREAWKQAAV